MNWGLKSHKGKYDSRNAAKTGRKFQVRMGNALAENNGGETNGK